MLSTQQMSHLFFCFLIFGLTMAQEGNNIPIPSIPQSMGELPPSISVEDFKRIWKFAREHDSHKTGLFRSTEPKTLLIPGDFSLINLVPQDGAHPLYLTEPKFENLRREFILDHLVEEPVTKESVGQGTEVKTLTGKTVLLVQDPSGTMWANGVRIENHRSSSDGSQVFVLSKPLFELTQKVRNAFHEIDHGNPFLPNPQTGPPLDLGGGTVIRFPESQPQPPAPPPSSDAGIGGSFAPSAIRPPAPPPSNFQK